MSTNAFDAILAQTRKNAADIQKLAKKLGVDVSAFFPDELKSLNDCLDTYSAFKVLIATVVTDARGELSLAGAADIATNFDKNWDKFAAEYNAIFNHSSSAAQTNVLETFARTHFGDKIFEAGSVIKNETPSILNGILGFKRGIDTFGGSYRNPEEAANKIKTGVSLIVNSTAQVANSANNVLKFLQGLKQSDPKGSAILSNISKLPQWRPVGSAISLLGIGAAGISMTGSARGAIDSLRKGDIAGAVQHGKAVLSQGKAIKNEIDKLRSGKFTNGGLPVGNISKSGANPGNANANAAQNKGSDDSKDSGNTDSYVCSTAKIKCTNGDKIAKLTVLPDRTIWLTGEPQANISDHQSMVNIAPFGKCHTTTYPPTGSATAAAHGKLTPMPCVPNTPFPWMNGKNDVLLKGQPALLKSSSCKCVWGGTISITFDGQSAGDKRLVETIPLQSYTQLENLAKLRKQAKSFVSEDIDLSGETLLKGMGLSKEETQIFKDAIMDERRKFAQQFYQDNTDFRPADIESHISCIDFEKPINTKRIPLPDTLLQFQTYELIDNPETKELEKVLNTGKYASPDLTATPTELGIYYLFMDKNGKGHRKVRSIIKVEKPRDVLVSTAAGTTDSWSYSGKRVKTKGGGLQYFMPN